MTSKRQIRVAMDQRFNRKAEKTKYLSAIVGHPDGTVSVEDNPGYIWARLGGDGGQIIQVYARGILPAYNLPIVVYRLPHRPRDYGIVDLDVDGWGSTGSGEEVIGYDGTGYLTKHGEQHQFLAGDTTYINWLQITTLRVYASGEFVIVIEQGILPRPGSDVKVNVQSLDLASHVPATGAIFCLISVDNDGVVVATDGSNVSDVILLDIGDIPDTPDGDFRLAAVRLYAGQTAIDQTVGDIVDLRWPQESVAGGSGAAITTAVFFLQELMAGICTGQMSLVPTLPTGSDLACDFDDLTVPLTAGYTIGGAGLTLIPAGVITLRLTARCDSGSSEVRLYWKLFSVYYGTPTMLIDPSENSGALTTSDAVYVIEKVLTDDLLMPATTALLYLEIWGTLISGPDTVVTITINGDTGARLTLPAQGSSIIGPGQIPLIDGHILVGGSDNNAAEVTMSGDAAIDNTGAVTVLQAAAAFALPGQIAPGSLSASQNDYNPTGLSGAAAILATSSNDINITGLQGGAQGRMLILMNNNALGGKTITLTAEDSASTTTNRFTANDDVTLSPQSSVLLRYHASRWCIVGGTGGGGAGTGDMTKAVYDTDDDGVVDAAELAANSLLLNGHADTYFQTALGYTPENAANKDTDGTLAANSDTKYASQKAVKTYIDGRISAADAVVYKGVIDCSANPNYPAADAGWLYRISVAGKIGGASGINVEVGDTILCIADGTASGNQATVGAYWDIIQANIDGALQGALGSTDNVILRSDGIGGVTAQGSVVTISDSGDIDVARSIIPHMRIGATGAPTTSAVLDLLSTDGAFLPPRLTTTQRNALTPTDGMLIFNTTTGTLQYYLSGWIDVGVEGGSGPPTGAAGGALGSSYPNPTLENLSHALGQSLALACGQATL